MDRIAMQYFRIRKMLRHEAARRRRTEAGMAGKDLRRLSKTELLELLVEQGRENIALRERLEKAEAELAERRLLLEESGSIAEAALKLSGVFEAAQRAIDLYRENCEQECAEMLKKASQKAGLPDGNGGKEDAE